MQKRHKVLPGHRFNRLVALEYISTPRTNERWKFLCDCGVIFEAYLTSVIRGHTKSCGCWKREKATTHGMSLSPEHSAWRGIMNRCYNISTSKYPDYGGRGIGVWPLWRYSFSAFLADVGCRPSPKHSLNRINNDGDYEPGNVEWATPKQQAANRRNTKSLTW